MILALEFLRVWKISCLNHGKPLSEGRGMGLYIVRKLLESFGGEIELLDERNEYGNRYKFLLVSNTSEEL